MATAYSPNVGQLGDKVAGGRSWSAPPSQQPGRSEDPYPRPSQKAPCDEVTSMPSTGSPLLVITWLLVMIMPLVE